ncbi:hypothetical protein ACFL5X_03505, partial [Candidatus Omnitrophota bacterium]
MRNKKNRRRKKLLGSSLERKLLILMFIAAVVPAGVVAVCLYYLIFNLFAAEVMIPEFIAYTLIPVSDQVNMIMLICLPLVLIGIWFLTVTLSHRITGPIYRLEKELDARIKGTKKGPIHLRKGDEKAMMSLVEK